MNKVLFISSEAYPLVKTGGLADVAGSLPKALLKEEQDVRVLLPGYPAVMDRIKKQKHIATTSYYHKDIELIESNLPGTKVKVWIVNCPAAFARPGGPYSDENGHAWHDNAFRFTIFCHTAVDIALNKLNINWQPDIVHCNDWQTGLVPALLSLHKIKPATIFTIHNLAYQGVFGHEVYADLSLPPQLWHMDGVEYYGNFSFLKGGIAYADKINTVSPNYAKEILSQENGYGLDGLLNYRFSDLSGILNGIDTKEWNPGTDQYIHQKYNRRSLDNKVKNKLALQKENNLAVAEDIPLIGMIGRLVSQKGIEMVLQVLHKLVSQPVQFVCLGSGEPDYEFQLNNWAKMYPENIHVTIGYNESFAHQIEAACDIFMMPSVFEPCGLNQLYSLRYGSLPVVTPVGGLLNTVIDTTQETIDKKQANGFVLPEITTRALISTILRALNYYNNQPDIWRQMQVTAMSEEHSWEKSADEYIKLYKEALKKSRHELI